MSVVYGLSIVHDCDDVKTSKVRGRERERLRKRGGGERERAFSLFVSVVLFDMSFPL